MSEAFCFAPVLAGVPRSPILLSAPHVGTEIPPKIAKRLLEPASISVPDTDWHLQKLYDWAPSVGVAMLYAKYSRYVVDLNRPKNLTSLYSDGRRETSLVPTQTFAGDLLYDESDVPDKEEMEVRSAIYYQPYHEFLAEYLRELRGEFSHVLLYDAHSIARFVPSIRPQKFPDIMVGTADGASCIDALSEIAISTCEEFGYSVAVNDPFKGGFITRNYADPSRGIHTLQIERSYDTYLQRVGEKLELHPTKSAKMQKCMQTLFSRLNAELSVLNQKSR